MNRAWLVVAAALAAGACASKDDTATCDRRMDVLAARLAPLGDEVPLAPRYAEGFEPIESERGEQPRKAGVAVEVARDGTARLEGREVALAEVIQRVEAHAPIDGGALYLIVDRRTPRATVEAMVKDLPDAVEARMVVMGPARSKSDRDRELEAKPSVKALIGRLDTASASERAMAFAEAMSKAIAPCTPPVRVMGQVAGVPAANKGRLIATELPKAIRACKCNLGDLDLVEYAVLEIFDAFGRPQRWIPLADGLALLPAS